MYNSYYIRDRSGACILNIFYYYQYCINNNIKYNGPIINENMLKSKKLGYHYKKNINTTKPILTFLNIPQIENNENKILSNNHIENIVITSDFCQLLYNNCKKNLYEIKKNNDFVVCIHVRRGDVCKEGKLQNRYTSNEYYVELIKVIKKYKSNVIIYIFSEKKTDEPFDVFEEMGCKLMLDTSIIEAFNFFIMCDIFIMSSSSFSIVPAIIKQNGISIYIENKYFKPLDHWIKDNKKEAIKKYIENYSSVESL